MENWKSFRDHVIEKWNEVSQKMLDDSILSSNNDLSKFNKDSYRDFVKRLK